MGKIPYFGGLVMGRYLQHIGKKRVKKIADFFPVPLYLRGTVGGDFRRGRSPCLPNGVWTQGPLLSNTPGPCNVPLPKTGFDL